MSWLITIIILTIVVLAVFLLLRRSSNIPSKDSYRIRGTQFVEMTLPRKWRLYKQPSSEIARNLLIFKPPHSRDVQISTFQRGMPLNAAEANSFLSILQKRPHKLASSEIESLCGLLDVYMDYPKLASCKTTEINGRGVLVATKHYRTENDFDDEGNYREGVRKYKAYEIFINASKDGQWVEAINYHALQGYYWRYKRAAMRAFHSIKWKVDT
jgi:hypothetical protein